MLFGNQGSSAPTPAQRPAPTPAPRQAASAPSPPVRKGPIRMQLPMDDNEFDEEEGIDAQSNKKMSIADAMRKTGGTGSDMDPEERSKKW